METVTVLLSRRDGRAFINQQENQRCGFLRRSGSSCPQRFQQQASKSVRKQYELQIRSREREHLEAFINEYMPEGSASEIVQIPDSDYEFRFYATRNDFAYAINLAVLEIDYAKFKPECKEPRYHNLLNRIWEVVFLHKNKKTYEPLWD
jgi:hypothetical protein